MKLAGTYTFLFLAFLLFAQGANAQELSEEAEVGLPFYSEHFAPQEYRQYPQNWAVTQDNRGVIYVANNDGVLEYDGASWRLIPTLTNAFVRSLAVDSTGTIYVGAKGDFGYLKPDSVGTRRYVSLYEEIPVDHQAFEDVWGTHITSDGVYFQANKRLFRWDGSQIQVWTTEKSFHTSFAVRDQFYVRDTGRGLLRLEDDSLRVVPGGAFFENRQVHLMLPRSDGSILIGEDNEGFYIYDGADRTVEPFPMEVEPFLEEYGLYHGTWLPSGHIALATLGGGVLIVDGQGNLVRILDQAAEIPDGTVNYVYPGIEGGLWMAFNNSGVAYTDPVSPLTVYSERLGLQGSIHDIQRHQGTLYVATGSGLFVLISAPLSLSARQRGDRTIFRKISEIPITWGLDSTDDGLLAAAEEGIYLINENRTQELADERAWTVATSDIYPNRIYAGARGGLVVIRQGKGGTWTTRTILDTEDQEIRSIHEGQDGTLWLSMLNGEVWRVQVSVDRKASVSRVDQLSAKDGLADSYNFATSIDERPIISSFESDTYLRRPVRSTESNQIQIEPDTSLMAPHDSSEARLRAIYEQDNGDVWMLVGNRGYIAHPQPDGSYAHEEIKALRFPKTDPVRIYVEDNGVAWIGTGRELIRYDSRIPGHHVSSFQALVRKVETFPEGKVIYGGAPPSNGDTFEPAPIPYEDNNLRFEVAAPLYHTPKPIKYQFKLEGREDEWSEWQENFSVQYADLYEGDYTFRVRARTPKGLVSEPASISLSILPPWYRTAWAYLGYIVGLAVIGLGSRRYYQIVQENKRAKEQAKELERERVLNERLQEANERLREANELKDNFLANTSHELRTPITTILGFTDVLRDEVDGHHEEFLDIIEESGQRLMRTLNALLDLAKLRSGVMEADLKRVDVVNRADDIVEMFEHKAEEKGIDLRLDAPETPVYTRLDDRYLERVLDNLVSNAVKFTEEGHVIVDVEEADDKVHIHVRDTGIGIDDEFLPYLFDDFKQESSGMDRSHEGTGLGLAITSRMVELMGGTIEVESVKGEGSVFTVIFPTAGAASSEASDPDAEEADAAASAMDGVHAEVEQQ